MNETAWTTNEIASAYERNFTLLEAARKEYSQLVSDFLTNLHRDLGVSANRAVSCEGVDAVSTISGSEFDTAISVGLSVMGESAEFPTPSGITITARAAAPTGGNPGHLRVAATAWFNDKTTSWNIEKLRAEIFEADHHADSKPCRPAADELLAIEVPVEEDGISQVADTIQHLRSRLAPFALKIVEEQRITELIKQTLLDCAEKLGKCLPVTNGNIERKVVWWNPGMHYIQLNAPDTPGFWVGYVVKTGGLLYGFNSTGNPPLGLADTFFARVKAYEPRSFGGYPCGSKRNRNRFYKCPG